MIYFDASVRGATVNTGSFQDLTLVTLDEAGDSAVQTAYFATFEVGSGERIEVKIPPREYGQFAEGDQGQLTHQGTWYRGFERRRVIPTDGSWEAPGGPSLRPPNTT